MFTSEQLITAASVIAEFPGLHYDMTEERFKKDSITWSRLMLWRWPPEYGPDRYPTRYWIEPAGHVSMMERCDWITPEEWPAWALTEQETSND
jgi:hypothetical protein